MPDRAPQYRFRGRVAPSAEVARPVAARRNAAADGGKNTSATLDIFDVIDSWGGWWGISARDVDKALGEIGKVDTLYVRLNSPGGEALEGVAIGNLLRAHAATVRITVYGLAASAASAVAMAGDVVNMAPGSMMMIHDAWNIVLGNADELRAEAGVLDKLSDGYAALYAKRAGGTTAQWRALMRAETWYTAQDAVDAKLADAVAVDPSPDVTPAADDAAEPLDGIGFDSVAARFDLSVFTRAPAAQARCCCGSNGADISDDPSMQHKDGCPTRAAQTPAEPPETQHTDPEEAVTMTETELKALRERLGLGEDADAAAINAKLDELEEQATKPDPAPAAAEPQIPAGKVLVSQNVLDELKEMAQAGAAARAKQLEQERDDTIEAAFKAGKISAERRDHWRAAWDKDPAGAKADLESLPARFPVGPAKGYAGDDGSTGDAAQPFTDDEAAALAQLAGTTKEALLA